VEKFVQYFHTYFNVTSPSEITAVAIEEKLHSAGGAHYGRGDGGGVSGGGEDFGGMKAQAARNFEQKGAHILSAGKSHFASSGASSVSGNSTGSVSSGAPQEKKEAPKKEAPKKEPPKKEVPVKEPPRKEAPVKEPPKKEAPKKEAPKKEPPKEEEKPSFMNEYQKKKQAVLAKKEEPKKEQPKEEPLEVRIAKAIQAFQDNGVPDDDTGDIDVFYGDIKDVVDEALLMQLRRMGQVEFAGSSLDDEAVLTLKKI